MADMTRPTYSPLKAALEKLTIPDVWTRLGLKGKPAASCRSPFRDDRNASFSVYSKGRRWKDHGTSEGGDAADFCAKARNLSSEDGARLLIELAGTNSLPQGDRIGKKNSPHPGAAKPEPYDPFKDKEKARRREAWPAFEVPTQTEIETIAALRGLSPEGVTLAAERGLLFCADSWEGRAWVVTDSRRVNAQARKLDGKPWEAIGGKKAWTLPGSVATWSVGIRESEDFPSIALVEGSADLMAAMHLIWVAGQEKRIAPVAMFGASMWTTKAALPTFRASACAFSRMLTRRASRPKAAGGTSSNRPGRRWTVIRSRASFLSAMSSSECSFNGK
jgi:hypothetical protein